MPTAFNQETQTAGIDSNTEEIEQPVLKCPLPGWFLHSCVLYLNWDDQRLDSDGTVDQSSFTGDPSVRCRLFTALWLPPKSKHSERPEQRLRGNLAKLQSLYDLASGWSHAVSFQHHSVGWSSHQIQGEVTQTPTLSGRSIKNLQPCFLTHHMGWGFLLAT